MGTGIRLTLSFAELKKQQILFPPIGEQEEIVKYINYKTTEIDRLVVELTYQVEYLKEYKQRLIADVVTGKINVQPD
jgi:restriction endonuclease S subunit